MTVPVAATAAKKRILVSNDDGYYAAGLLSLVEALHSLGEVIVVAPEQDRSGASNSLTLDRPLSVKKAPNGFQFVNGTPTDCVHIAVTGMLDPLPDLVVSGINLGANMGDDTLYSGTVAAATEAFLLGIPALAVSLVTRSEGQHHFATAGHYATNLARRLLEQPFPEPVLLNVNVPDLPLDRVEGIAVTRLGKRHKAEPVVPATTPHGRPVFWIGAAGPAQDAGPGTDFYAVKNGRVSVTPLQVDLTHKAQLSALQSWL